jgi:hypothetical protein
VSACPRCGRPLIRDGQTFTAEVCGSAQKYLTEPSCYRLAYERLSAAVAALKAHRCLTYPGCGHPSIQGCFDALRSAIAALPGGAP